MQLSIKLRQPHSIGQKSETITNDIYCAIKKLLFISNAKYIININAYRNNR